MRPFHIAVLTVVATAITLPASIRAAERDFIFTYDYEGATLDLYGVQRCVGLDAAMRLDDPALVGCQILGVSIDIPVKEGCSCDPVASAWLTRKLQVDGEYNLPDLQEINGEIKNIGTESEPRLRLDLTFPEPYTLTEEGVYVGYSVTVTDCKVPGSGWTAKYPLVTVRDIDKPESLMIHCTKDDSVLPQKYPEWTDIGKDIHQALAMRVLMRGEVSADAASLEPLQTLYAAPSTSGEVYVNLNNQGTNPVSSIVYSYTIPSGEEGETQTFSQSLTIEPPVPAQTGAYVTLDLPFEVPQAEGRYSVPLRVEKVNGVDNGHATATALDMVVVPFLPVNRPLIEDYTGLWCGYCPAVYVAVRQMQDKYGDLFLPISYHVTDQLQSVKTAELPSSSYGIPKVYMGNRNENINYDDLEQLWLRSSRRLTPASIEVNLSWTDSSRTALKAESKVKFVYDEPEAAYRLAYALVEDRMSDPAWLQTNYYSNDDFSGPYWDLFCGKSYKVAGLEFNDVVVSFPATRGIEGSLPASPEGGREYTHSDVLFLKDAVCEYAASPNFGNNLIKNPDALRIVALLIDGRTGNVCNAATTGYAADAPVSSDPSGAVATTSAGHVVATEYYSLHGRRLPHLPASGVVVKVDRLSDGTLLPTKIIL